MGSQPKVYKRRWYMLLVVCISAFMQGFSWNTWSPISPAVEPVFGWHDSTVALLTNWGPITYVINVLPAAWLLDTQGLRKTLLVAALLITLGAGLRCISTASTPFLYLTHTAQFLNGLAGPIVSSIPPVFSALWFPVSQRTTATSIACTANYFGMAASFAVGLAMVPDHKTDHETKHDVWVYMILQFAIAALGLVLTMINFPDKPPRSPTLTAAINRTDFIQGIKELLTHRNFWYVSLSYGIFTGVYSGWGAYLAPNLKNFLSSSKAESESGWIGFYATLAGAAGGALLGFCMDLFSHRIHDVLCLMCALSGGCALWFALICAEVVSNSTFYLYFCAILEGFLINATIPLYFEMAVEITYPIAEGSTTCLLTSWNSVAGCLFLFVPFIPDTGNAWANWTMAIGCLVGFIFLILTTATKNRTQVDLGYSQIDVKGAINPS